MRQKRQTLKYLGETLSLFQACFTPSMCPPHYLTTASLLHLVTAAGGSQSFWSSMGSAEDWGQNVTVFLCCSFLLVLFLFFSVQVPLGYLLLPWFSLIPISCTVELARAGCAHHGAISDFSHSNHPAAPCSQNLSMDTHWLIAALHFSYFLYMKDWFVLPQAGFFLQIS